MKRKKYRCCAVPNCTNTSKTAPNKIFIDVPRKADRRKKWLNLAGRKFDGMSVTSPIYFCEDHFDLPNDMANYMKYHIMGDVGKVMLKPGSFPSKFQCQSSSLCQSDEERILPPTEKPQPISLTKPRFALVLVPEALRDNTVKSEPEELNEPLSSSLTVKEFFAHQLEKQDSIVFEDSTFKSEPEDVNEPLLSLSLPVYFDHQPINQDKEVQVCIKTNFRSQSTQTDLGSCSIATSSCKTCRLTVSTSFKVQHRKPAILRASKIFR